MIFVFVESVRGRPEFLIYIYIFNMYDSSSLVLGYERPHSLIKIWEEDGKKKVYFVAIEKSHFQILHEVSAVYEDIYDKT